MAPDWRKPASEELKAKILGRTWGEVVNTSVWFEIGEISDLTPEEMAMLAAAIFANGKPTTGKIEIFPSGALEGAYILRAEGRVRLLPAITVRGRYCPLYQYGHGGGGPKRASAKFVNFRIRLNGRYRYYK